MQCVFGFIHTIFTLEDSDNSSSDFLDFTLTYKHKDWIKYSVMLFLHTLDIFYKKFSDTNSDPDNRNSVQ